MSKSVTIKEVAAKVRKIVATETIGKLQAFVKKNASYEEYEQFEKWYSAFVQDRVHKNIKP